uniref:Replication initiation protein n=1 Tax=Oenococcus oeni TaxID=1247 RepID=Q9ZF12_OENOE|nr:hypothetical protein [Oenococcus oeni]
MNNLDDKKRAPSNSTLTTPISGIKKEYRVSVDRITLTADCPLEVIDGKLSRWMKETHLFIPLSSGGFKVIEDNLADTPEQVAFVEYTQFQKNRIRIDFNPNHSMTTKGGQWILSKIATLKNKKFSRCDVAFDIFNSPIIEKYRIFRPGTSSKYFLSAAGKPETIYYGAQKSEAQIRQYNKLVEQTKKRKTIPDNIKNWWRLELQLRGRKISDYPQQVKSALDNFIILGIDDRF